MDAFAADFEQHCEGGGPALLGAIRFNSTRPSLAPFGVAFAQPSNMWLDGPVDGTVVGRPFTIAGWALNSAAATGTGVDTVHVYAFPPGGAPPIFLGVAAYGAARPDVGGLFGARFTNCGFNLTAGEGLPPAPYHRGLRAQHRDRHVRRGRNRDGDDSGARLRAAHGNRLAWNGWDGGERTFAVTRLVDR